MSSLGIFNKETKTYQEVAGTEEAILALQSANSK